MGVVTSSPVKYVWGIGAILFNLAKFPILWLYYLPQSLRPHPEWTLFQSVMNHVMNSFLFHTAYVEAVTPLFLEPGSFGDRFVAIPKGPDSVFVGVVKSDAAIEPAPTGGIWYPDALKQVPSQGERPIILHFHPGGYAMSDVRTDATFAAKLLTDRVGSHALWSLYRLATNPHGRFPAALQDALSAYHYLTEELSIPASRIILSGDSAGGHVVICMLRYLAENETSLPAPRGALLWSPAIDLAAATRPETISGNRNHSCDYLDPTFIAWGARRFVNDTPGSASYMNPLGAAFQSPCPMWVFCGGNEIFYDEVSEFVKQMDAIQGNSITYRVERLSNHDVFFAGNLTGWKAEARRAAGAAGDWVASLDSA